MIAQETERTAGVEVARTADEVEALRGTWEGVRWSRMDADIDFFLAVAGSRPGVLRPHALFRDGGRAALVARVENVQLRSYIGYRPVYQPTLRSLTVVHGGLAGAESEADALALVDELRGALVRGEADVAQLPAVPVGSPLHRAAGRRPGLACRQHGADVALHRRLRLPATFDELLASRSKSTRESVKRYSKKLLRDHGDRLKVEVLRRPDDRERIFRDLEVVAAKTYQRGLGVAFDDTPEQRALTELGLARGWFRVWVLYLDGEPIAFWPGYAYNDVFFIGTPGYDPAYADYRVGQFILTRMLGDLCADEGVTFVDYGFGDAEYKRRFGSESWEETDVRIFAPTFKAVRANAVTTGIDGSVRLAKKVVGGERAARIKKRWRARLEGGANPPASG